MPIITASCFLSDGEETIRGIGPSGVGNKFAVLIGIGIGHDAAGAISGDESAISGQAEIVIREEEEVVSQFVSENTRPILAKIGAGVTKATPSGAHADLTGDRLG